MPAARSSAKRQPADLVIDDGGAIPCRQRRHGPDKVVAFPDDPAGADDVVPRDSADDGVARGFRLAVDSQRGGRLVLTVALLEPSKT